jgi:hypothetical protein
MIKLKLLFYILLINFFLAAGVCQVTAGDVTYKQLSNLTRLCIDECVKKAGSGFSYTSPEGKKCIKAHKLMEKGIDYWNKGMTAKYKGNMKAFRNYDREARQFIYVGGTRCPKTKKRVIKELGLMK